MKNIWTNKPKSPRRKGWYVTRTEDGHVAWRCWGCGAWWQQIEYGPTRKAGWIEWFDGDGEGLRFDFMPRSRKPVELDAHELPEVAEYLLTELAK